MEELSEKLFSILTQEIKLYEEFLLLLQEEKVMMITLSLNELARVNQQKETLILRIKIMEETRSQLISKMALKLECPPTEICISYLAKVLSVKAKERLENYRTRLSSLFSAIKDLNQLNGFLSGKALSYIEETLILLRNIGYPQHTYLSNGHMGEREKAGQMVSALG